MRVITSAVETARATAGRRLISQAVSDFPKFLNLHLTPSPQFAASSSRSLATAANPSEELVKRKFPKLDDGLTFDDFVSGEALPDASERVVLGNTTQ